MQNLIINRFLIFANSPETPFFNLLTIKAKEKSLDAVATLRTGFFASFKKHFREERTLPFVPELN